MRNRIRQALGTILSLEDRPHAIAMGVALGLFIGWTPTVGIQMLLVLAIAPLLRANKLPALIGVYISNPYTMLPMYWLEYEVGSLITANSLSFDHFETTWANYEWLDAVRILFTDLAIPMWLGGMVLGLANAVPSYFITRWLLSRYRRGPHLSESASVYSPTPQQRDDSLCQSN